MNEHLGYDQQPAECALPVPETVVGGGELASQRRLVASPSRESAIPAGGTGADLGSRDASLACRKHCILVKVEIRKTRHGKDQRNLAAFESRRALRPRAKAWQRGGYCLTLRAEPRVNHWFRRKSVA
jgi:hypothetical protein